MSFIDFLLEDGDAGGVGAVGDVSSAGIATSRSSLFAGAIARLNKKTGKYKLKKMFESIGDGNFSSADVVSKLADAEKQNSIRLNAVIYGIDDEDGNITKVYVPHDQSEEFAKALQELLQDDELVDVSEILFNLRNSFDILNVEWPDLPEDEEVDNKLEKPEGSEQEDGESDDSDHEDDEPTDGQPGGVAPTEEPMQADGASDNQSLLLKVLDMLKADADAKTAEMTAKKAEAEVEQARLAIELTNSKVKQEEDIMRAEQHFKTQQEQKKEDDRIAKLAKYRAELTTGAQYEGVKMNLVDLMNEDVNDDIHRLNAQISDLNLRKSRAMKVYDDQIRRLQQQLALKDKIPAARAQGI